MDLDDGAKLIAAILGIFGLYFTGLQIRANTKQRRAQYITDFILGFWRDAEVVETYYLFEYSQFWYDQSTFHTSDLEKKVDRLLEFLGCLAKTHYAGLVSFEDIALLRYEFLVVYQNPELHRYFAFVDGWYKTRGIEGRPFDEFRLIADRLEKTHFTGQRRFR